MGEAARILAPRIWVNRADPTRTLTLRRRFSADMSRRFRALTRDITTAVVEMDVLGLGEAQARREALGVNVAYAARAALKSQETGSITAVEGKLITLEPPNAARFAFRRPAVRAEEFMQWLGEQQKAGILEVIQGPAGPEPWTNTYVRSAYQKGLASGRANLRAAGADLPSFTSAGASFATVMNQPFHAERLALIYQRTFTDLKGITEWQSTQISRVLTQGMAEGIGPNEMARRMNDIIIKKTGAEFPPNHPKGMRGMNRARLLARTETVETFNRAAVAEYERAEDIIGRRIMVQWESAGDERVRDVHEDRSGRIFTREEFLTLIGDPNCRCTGIPIIEGVSDRFPANV